MKTIIIPTDFSPASFNAMQYAANMAIEIEASLLLFHVYQIPVAVSDVPVVLVSVDELKKNAETQLQQTKEEVNEITSGKVKVYTEAVLGNTIDELEELGKRVNPFAVVLGSHGSSGMERILFGSTTLTAIRHLTWPIIVVHAGTKYRSIKKIGFACDFRQVVKTTPTKYIKDIVGEFKAELLILNVDHENKHFTPDTPVESLLLHSMFADLSPTYHFIDNTDVEEGINQFADQNNIDLVITIPKKHKLLDALFKKSSTKKLVIQSHVPIMCVHE